MNMKKRISGSQRELLQQPKNEESDIDLASDIQVARMQVKQAIRDDVEKFIRSPSCPYRAGSEDDERCDGFDMVTLGSEALISRINHARCWLKGMQSAFRLAGWHEDINRILSEIDEEQKEKILNLIRPERAASVNELSGKAPQADGNQAFNGCWRSKNE